MTQIPQDDEPLIRFLKQNQPLPPATMTPIEEQLMQLVVGESKLPSRKPLFLFWIVPSAIAAAGLVTWLGWKGSYPSVQTAVQSEELESFVIESWQGSLGEELSYATDEANTEISWLILEELDSHLKTTTNHK